MKAFLSHLVETKKITPIYETLCIFTHLFLKNRKLLLKAFNLVDICEKKLKKCINAQPTIENLTITGQIITINFAG